MEREEYGEWLETAQDRLKTLEAELADPTIYADRRESAKKSKEYARQKDLVEALQGLVQLFRRQVEAEEVIEDPEEEEELKELAQEELDALSEEIPGMEDRAKGLLLPTDEDEDRGVILEIRAGTGGEEAALFAADLFRMYQRYADGRSWKTSLVTSHSTGSGGMKEIIASLGGERVYGRLRYESGVHRVQRVPVTESSGRIHTSAVTVAVLPEAEEVDIDIDPEHIRVDRFRSSGPGGQSVNTTDSAIRVTHLPTGEVVSCQDEKSQHKNLAKAMKVLRSRLLQRERARQEEERSEIRRQQVGSGDRSEKIRTYNYPQNRVTDHRIGMTLYSLDRFMEGEMGEMLTALSEANESKRLHAFLDRSGHPET